jgi:hypothetical protein
MIAWPFVMDVVAEVDLYSALEVIADAMYRFHVRNK